MGKSKPKPKILNKASKKPPVIPKIKKPTHTKVEFDLVLKELKKHYPDAHCALNFTTPFELLVATALSAQCTDERVNKVTPDLFKKYPDAKAMAKAPVEDLEEMIRSTGFYKNKAKNLKACAIDLVEKHNGEVPKTMEELYQLAGVGRKTANVVLGNAYGISSGVVVDTHVTRLSNRFGWVSETDAVKIEAVLNKICPQDDWIMLSHYLISHGRAICVARSPKCPSCFLNNVCPKRGV
ncbi:MAG: endo III-related endonuclease [Pseudobdellovibrio sp.]|nr:endo III-related endonuclease [Pseudobdellovibrio sp.]